MVRDTWWVFVHAEESAFVLNNYVVKVPYDKPKESLEMVRRWLAGEEL